MQLLAAGPWEQAAAATDAPCPGSHGLPLSCVGSTLLPHSPISCPTHLLTRALAVAAAAAAAPAAAAPAAAAAPTAPAAAPRRTCDTCVMELDHHCWYLGTCIGQANLRSFIAWLVRQGGQAAGCALRRSGNTAPKLASLLPPSPATAPRQACHAVPCTRHADPCVLVSVACSLTAAPGYLAAWQAPGDGSTSPPPRPAPPLSPFHGCRCGWCCCWAMGSGLALSWDARTGRRFGGTPWRCCRSEGGGGKGHSEACSPGGETSGCTAAEMEGTSVE